MKPYLILTSFLIRNALAFHATDLLLEYNTTYTTRIVHVSNVLCGADDILLTGTLESDDRSSGVQRTQDFHGDEQQAIR